jgi:hypothetical protein
MHIKAGFRRAGINPWNLDELLGNPLVVQPPPGLQTLPARAPLEAAHTKIKRRSIKGFVASVTGSPIPRVKPPPAAEELKDPPKEVKAAKPKPKPRGRPKEKPAPADESEAETSSEDEEEEEDLADDSSSGSDGEEEEEEDDEDEDEPPPRRKGVKRAAPSTSAKSTPKAPRKSSKSPSPAKGAKPRGKPPKLAKS